MRFDCEARPPGPTGLQGPPTGAEFGSPVLWGVLGGEEREFQEPGGFSNMGVGRVFLKNSSCQHGMSCLIQIIICPVLQANSWVSRHIGGQTLPSKTSAAIGRSVRFLLRPLRPLERSLKKALKNILKALAPELAPSKEPEEPERTFLLQNLLPFCLFNLHQIRSVILAPPPRIVPMLPMLRTRFLSFLATGSQRPSPCSFTKTSMSISLDEGMCCSWLV